MVILGWSSNELWNLNYDKIPIKKVQFLPIFLMGMSCLNCNLYFPMLTTLPKCMAWIEKTTAMLGVR
jgi:hypothetical protein